MNKLQLPPEQLRNARPETVGNLGQLVAGQVIIGFDTYSDIDGIINTHRSRLAVVSGPAYRIRDGQIIDRGIGLGKHLRVDPLSAYTRPQTIYGDPTWLHIEGRGVEGVEGVEGVDAHYPPAGLMRGFLAVREEPYQTELNLEVGPGLFVNGGNDYFMLHKGEFMDIALDSDPRLAGLLNN